MHHCHNKVLSSSSSSAFWIPYFMSICASASVHTLVLLLYTESFCAYFLQSSFLWSLTLHVAGVLLTSFSSYVIVSFVVTIVFLVFLPSVSLSHLYLPVFTTAFVSLLFLPGLCSPTFPVFLPSPSWQLFLLPAVAFVSVGLFHAFPLQCHIDDMSTKL